MKHLFLFFCISLLIPAVIAVGISPPQYKIEFKPGEVRTFSHTVLNSRDQPTTVRINITGGLAKYITTDTETLEVPANGAKSFSYTWHAPDDLTPGWSKANIRVLDGAAGGGGMFGIAVGVVGNLRVFRPYPEKYVEGVLIVPSVNEGEDVSYEARLSSRGEDDIEDANLEIVFQAVDGDKITTVKHGNIDIPSMEEIKIQDVLDADLFDSGMYIAMAKLDYDEVLYLNRTFNVGTYNVEIINNTDTLYAGRISPVQVDIRNLWNGELTDVYATVNINGRLHQSHEKNLKKFAEDSLTVFVDDQTLILGDVVKGTIAVHFADKMVEKKVSFKVIDKPVPETEEPETSLITTLATSTTTYLILAVILLIILNIVLLRKRK